MGTSKRSGTVDLCRTINLTENKVQVSRWKGTRVVWPESVFTYRVSPKKQNPQSTLFFTALSSTRQIYFDLSINCNSLALIYPTNNFNWPRIFWIVPISTKIPVFHFIQASDVWLKPIHIPKDHVLFIHLNITCTGFSNAKEATWHEAYQFFSFTCSKEHSRHPKSITLLIWPWIKYKTQHFFSIGYTSVNIFLNKRFFFDGVKLMNYTLQIFIQKKKKHF